MARPTEVQVPASGDVPAYTLRVNPRAKQVRLTVTPREGLIVTVPSALHDYDPTDALRGRRTWIDEALSHFAERRESLASAAADLLPTRVTFAATGEAWPVAYVPTGAAAVRARVAASDLVVSGPIDDANACLASLSRWLQRAAKDRLPEILEQESRRTGLAHERVEIRGQRSRWAGCSTSGAVTLNRALLFLPPELVRAVMLHELAHLEHPNHSDEFWRVLREIDRDADAHARLIKASWDEVPVWAEPR